MTTAGTLTFVLALAASDVQARPASFPPDSTSDSGFVHLAKGKGGGEGRGGRAKIGGGGAGRALGRVVGGGGNRGRSLGGGGGAVGRALGGGNRGRSISGGNRGRSIGGGNNRGNGATSAVGRTLDRVGGGHDRVGGGNDRDDDDRLDGGAASGNGKVNGRGFLGGNNWGGAPIGGEYFGGRSFDGGIGGRAFDDENPRGSTDYVTAPGIRDDDSRSTRSSGGASSGSVGVRNASRPSDTPAAANEQPSAGSGGTSLDFDGPDWPGSGAAAVAKALASGRGQSAGSRAVILTAVAVSAAEAAATAARAADAISAWPWSNPQVARPVLAAANAALTAGKSAQAALLATDPKSAKLWMDTAQTQAQESREQAQAAVKAWQAAPGLSGRTRTAAEAAVRAAEAAGVELQVASRVLSIARTRAVAQKGSRTASALDSGLSPPSPGRKPMPPARAAGTRPGVEVAALTSPREPAIPAPSVSDHTLVMVRAETAAVRASKANADAQIAAIAAAATVRPSEAASHADAAQQAARDAKAAADEAALAHARAWSIAKRDMDSIAAQAQEEVAARAAEKARLHATAAARAAERARSFHEVDKGGPSPTPASIGGTR